MRIFLLTLFLWTAASADLLTLKEAESRAAGQGYEIRIDSIDNIARTWQKKNVIAGYLPQVNYSANLMRFDDSTATLSGMTYDEFGQPVIKKRPNTLSHELSLSQPLTNGGMEIIAIKLAEHTKKAQELGYGANRADLILRVRQSYFNLIKAKEQVKIAEADLHWAEQNLEKAQSRFESGVLPETELLRWKSTVIDKKAFLLQSQALDEYQQADLKVAMGMDPASGNSIEPDSFSVYEQYYQNFQLDSGIIDSNLRLQSLDGFREISHDQRKMAFSAALPKLNAFGTLGKDIRWNGTDFDDRDSGYTKWTVGIGLNVPIFSGFRNSTGYIEKKYDAIKADIDYQKTRNMMSANLIRIRKFMEAAQIGAESSREQYELNLKNFEIMNDRYSLGQLSQTDLLEMSTAVAGSRLNYITRTLETLYYYSEYQNAIGKLEVIQ